ncbi:hypothetical protein Tco_0880254 [Tanacetum coccineum]
MTLRDPNIYVSDLSFSGVVVDVKVSAAAHRNALLSRWLIKQTHQSQMPLYSQLEGTGSSVGTTEGSAEARYSSSSSPSSSFLTSSSSLSSSDDSLS